MGDEGVRLPHGARGIEVGDFVMEMGRDKVAGAPGKNGAPQV